MTTTDQLMELKKQVGEIRDKSIQAKATMVEVENNIQRLNKELEELGIKDADKAKDEITKLEEKADKLYEQAKSKIEKWL